MAIQIYVVTDKHYVDTGLWTELGMDYALQFFQLLGIPFDPIGEMRAKDLAPRVEKALQTCIPDAPRTQEVYRGGKVVDSYPKPYSLAEVLALRLRELQTLCEKAGDIGRIQWS